jgi:hypothetical protein
MEEKINVVEGDEYTEEKKIKRLPVLIGILVLVTFVLFSLIFVKELGLAKKYLFASVTSLASVTVGNVAPIVSGATIVGNSNGDTEIVLTEGTTTPILITGTITDANGCIDLNHVDVAIYRNGTTCAQASDADNLNCYFKTISRATIIADSTNCTGSSDTTYSLSADNSYESVFALQYYAMAGSTTTAWKVSITPYDGASTGVIGTAGISSGTAVNTTTALAVSENIAYGAVANGSNSNTTDPAPSATITNTGNSAIDYKVSGEDLTCPTSGNSIAVGNESYSQTQFTLPGGTALTTSPGSRITQNIVSQTSALTETATSYWHITVPYGVSGVCSGNVAFIAVSH